MDPAATFLSVLGSNRPDVATIALIMGVFTRFSALAFFLPGLAERTVSPRIRLTVAFAITLMVVPIVITGQTGPTTLSQIAILIAAEAIAGALLGFTIRITVYAIQTAGSIASQSFSLAQLFGPGLDQQPEPPISTLLMVTAIVLAVSSGLHFHVVTALIMSFEVLPIGLFPGADETGRWAANRAAFSFSVALSLALPFVVLGFIYNLAIGAANRAMPQLMVAFVGVPAVTLAGLVLLALTAPILLQAWLKIIHNAVMTLSGYAS